MATRKYTQAAFALMYRKTVELLGHHPSGLTRDELLPKINKALADAGHQIDFDKAHYLDSFLLAMCAVEGSQLQADESNGMIRYYLRPNTMNAPQDAISTLLSRLDELRRTAPTLDNLEEPPNETAFANAERFIQELDEWGWLKADARINAVADGGLVCIWENAAGQWLFDAMNDGECMISWIKPDGKSTFWLGNLNAIFDGFRNQNLVPVAA